MIRPFVEYSSINRLDKIFTIKLGDIHTALLIDVIFFSFDVACSTFLLCLCGKNIENRISWGSFITHYISMHLLNV